MSVRTAGKGKGGGVIHEVCGVCVFVNRPGHWQESECRFCAREKQHGPRVMIVPKALFPKSSAALYAFGACLGATADRSLIKSC